MINMKTGNTDPLRIRLMLHRIVATAYERDASAFTALEQAYQLYESLLSDIHVLEMGRDEPQYAPPRDKSKEHRWESTENEQPPLDVLLLGLFHGIPMTFIAAKNNGHVEYQRRSAHGILKEKTPDYWMEIPEC